jgi:putative hemolysin
LPERAAELGCLYCDGEFWMTRLNSIRDQIVELGRVCVSVEHRNGLTIRLLWTALLKRLETTGQRYAIGAASVSLDDGGELATRLYRYLCQTSMAAEPWRTWPRRRLTMLEHSLDSGKLMQVPPLLKAYLRMGARLLGEPHHDPDFGCADFPVMVDMWAMDRRLLDRVKG